ELLPGSPLLAEVRRLGLTVPGMLDLADRIAPHTAETVRFHPTPPPVEAPGARVLSAVGLRHRYEGTEIDALAGVDLTLCAGERVALLGGNGAGKSTLLGLLSGRIEGGPDLPGTVTVPQDPDLALFCPTVAAELAYGPREAGLSGTDLETRVAQAADALSITDLLDRAPQSLSRGQRLRCAVAAALSCRPGILLLDEPTSGQDHDQIERMMIALRAGLSDGVLLFATHDVDLALRHATRVIVLHDGRKIADASPAEALADLPADVPVILPPLAALCTSRGIPPTTAAALAAVAVSSDVSLPLPAVAAPTPEPPPPAPTTAPIAAGLDPRTRLGLISAAGILAISLERPESLLLFALTCAVPLLWVGMDRKWLRRGLLAVAAIIWSTVLSQGLFYADQPRVSLGHLGPLHLYREGVTYGLAQSMRFVGLSLGGIALAVSTPPDRMFAALVRLRIPFGLALMAATALRFLPEIGREALTVRQARAARGRPTWKRGPVAWLALEVGLLRPIVARSWRRAQNLAESLDARGFDPLAERTWRRPLRMRAVDWSLIGAATAVSLTVASARILYALYTAEAVYIPALRPLYGFVRTWL
ncbi:MAG: energy-coupling factor transporter ATP-binding protein EcfA2, partial [Myxococcota bacterium]